MRYNGGIGHCRSKCAEAPHTGTTIVACVYKDGVVLGSDGRVSVGNYISNRASNKIAALADHVFLLRSGSAPDAQLVSDHGENRAAIIKKVSRSCMKFASCFLKFCMEIMDIAFLGAKFIVHIL